MIYQTVHRRVEGNLDVDKVAAALDDVHVGVVDRLLVVLDASRPIAGRAEDLKEQAR